MAGTARHQKPHKNFLPRRRSRAGGRAWGRPRPGPAPRQRIWQPTSTKQRTISGTDSNTKNRGPNQPNSDRSANRQANTVAFPCGGYPSVRRLPPMGHLCCFLVDFPYFKPSNAKMTAYRHSRPLKRLSARSPKVEKSVSLADCSERFSQRFTVKRGRSGRPNGQFRQYCSQVHEQQRLTQHSLR